MASGNNNTPFFGCKISLISKSEIRYEGLLYTIDPKESTIALAKVRSFGSEDRVVDRPVPPRDDIFEFIIFRASDIKDLIVDDPPPTPSAPTLADPAIVQAHATSTSFPSSFPQPSITSASQPAALQQLQRATGPQATKPSAASSSSEPTTSVSQSGALDSTSAKPKATSAAAAAAANSANSFQKTNNNNASNANRQQNQRNFNNKQHQQQQNQQQHQSQPNHRSNDGHANSNQHHQMNSFGNNSNYGNRPNTNFVRRNNPMNNGQNQQQNNNRDRRLEENSNYQRNGQQSNFRSNNFSNNRYPSRQHVNGGPFNRRPNQNNRNIGLRPGHKPFGTAIPDSEFDFEKAQNDFKILEEKLANLKVNGSAAGGDEGSEPVASDEATVGSANDETVDPVGADEEKEKCYNKSKSFFDQISCEALEREKGVVQRVDWKTERKMNRETFGVVPPRRTPMYRGNRGGYNGHNGGGYRGYRQNTGNYHHPNNRNRTNSQRSSNPNANATSTGSAVPSNNNKSSSTNTPNSKSASNGVSSATAAVASTTTPTIASIVAATAAQMISPAKN